MNKETIQTDNTYSELYDRNNLYKIGTLKILGSNFERILVQTDNNNFFLSHDINGEFSNIGSIFLDYRNKLTDRKLLVYGHNSKTIKDAPFHFLENYLDYLENDLEEAAFTVSKELRDVKEYLVSLDVKKVVMSGSGSTFILFVDTDKKDYIYNIIKKETNYLVF